MRKVSLKDIAKIADVSIATVSLVLSGKNEKGRVSEELANKIRKIAKSLNYQPNRLAVGLKSGKTNTVGLIVADISNSFFGKLAYFIQKEMENHHYAVIILNTDESSVQSRKMTELLLSRRVDGIIIVPTDNEFQLINELMLSKTPLVVVDRPFYELNVSSVYTNNYVMANNATNYLIHNGCKRILSISYDNSLSNICERRQGYKDALKNADLWNESLMKTVRFKYLEEEINKVLDEYINPKNNIDGIFFTTNTIATIGLKVLLKKGVKIGTDILIVCYDENDIFDFLNFSIPHIVQPIKEMGTVATQLLLSQINNQSFKNEKVQLEASLKIP